MRRLVPIASRSIESRLIQLRRRLASANISQSDIAASAGVTRACVSLVLAGRSRSRRVLEVAELMANNPSDRPPGRWGERHRVWFAKLMAVAVNAANGVKHGVLWSVLIAGG